MTSTGSSVSLENLQHSYAGVTALNNFSLGVAPGELVALLGPSGCGKTTALRAVAGFLIPDSGRIIVGDQDVTTLASQKRDMGMVFQSYSLFPNLSVRDNVEFGLRLRHVNSNARRARSHELLEMVGLADQAVKYPHQLSGGQQQRVALARALAVEPSVLLLDEPLSALDAKVRAELREQIQALQKRLAMTTIFVTHDQEEALSIADRVVVMNKGQAEQISTPQELYSQPATTFVAEFVGVSSRFRCERSGATVNVFGREVSIRNASDPFTGQVHALLRPEEVHVSVSAHGNARVIRSSFLGSSIRLDIETPQGIVRADVPTADAVAVGSSVELELHATDVLIAPFDAAKEIQVA